MVAKVILFSYKYGEISNFLNKFYNSNVKTDNPLFWEKTFPNPADISEIIAAFLVQLWVLFRKSHEPKLTCRHIVQRL